MIPLPPPSYFQQLNAYLNAQAQKVQELERRVGQLQQELEALKKQRGVTVEKIEYKFDQLKIEKLDGTLHIGISPDLSKSIEDLSVGGQSLQMTDAKTDMRSPVRIAIDSFLDDECPRLIRELQASKRLTLGDTYADVMIQDMKNQVDGRISYYTQTISDDASSGGDKSPLIINKIKSDITVAIERHLEQKRQQSEVDT
ncbi:spore germination protein GerPC [Paenibacillus ginsengarvi]|nr:spore germination protein GerPC [Paenibacillus ginsengarvi]